MKKQFFCLLLSVSLLCGLFAGCGSGADSRTTMDSTASLPAETAPGFDGAEPRAADTAASPTAENGAAAALPHDAKLIRTADVSAETKDFPAADQSVRTLTERSGGYLETASTGGAEGSRWGNYTVRVPQAQFDAFLNTLGDACHVLSQSVNQQDIGMQYYDAETHVAMLKTKHERLLALLAKSESMEDIIALQNALSDCEYELEQYEGTLRHYDDLVGFSTIRLDLSEVPGLSAVPRGAGLGSELKTAAAAGLHGLTGALRTVLVGLVTVWPLVLLLLLAGGVSLALLRKRRRAAKKAPPHTDTEPPQE